MPQIKDSLYEQLNPLTTVAGQHFVDDFSGDTPDVLRWGFGYQDSTTGNLASMGDSVNGGLLLTTGTAVDNQAIYMSFMTGTSLTGSDNGTMTTIPIRPFSSGLCNMIATVRINEDITTHGNQFAGFTESGRGDCAGDNMAGFYHHRTKGNFHLRTSNSGGSQNDTTTGVTADNEWHTIKILSNVTADPTPAGTGVSLVLDGVLKATNTTAIGYFSENVAPLFSTQRSLLSSGASSMNISYMEAWNTV